MRNITNLDEHLSDSTASRFIDLKPVTSDSSQLPEIDLEAKKLLDDLKTKKIPSKLRRENIFKFDVS